MRIKGFPPPKYEEINDLWYVDFASLYPHIMAMFNLFNEVDKEYSNAWHGNKLFQTKGYYDISNWKPLCRNVAERLKERIDLKIADKDNTKIYALKIWLNALYGCGRSSVFEQIHTKNFGWDVCWLGQQIQKLTEDMMKDFGFDTVAGDTDSLFLKARDEQFNNREYVKECLNTIIDVIKDNVPFPIDTFKIDIENYIDIPNNVFKVCFKAYINSRLAKIFGSIVNVLHCKNGFATASAA